MWTESVNFLYLIKPNAIEPKPLKILKDKYRLTAYFIYTTDKGKGKIMNCCKLKNITNYTNLYAMSIQNAITTLNRKGEIVISITMVSKEKYDATNY